MATVTDLANIAAATAAGYKLREYTRGASFGGSVERVCILSKQLGGETGTTGKYQFEAVGTDLATATTARTNALSSLNAQRRHRYAGAPGAASGATVATFPDGNATVPTVDVT